MSYTFRPAVRENTPLIIGIAGPTKSGKTYSALRIATGLANGGPIIMLNAEGPRGHQYAETFQYLACDLEPPFRPTHYTEALAAAAEMKPSVVIIDSASHMHDGPGGVLDWHEEELDRMAGDDHKRRERATFAAWVKPKAAENEFIYGMLGMRCPVILCMRAKEKLKLVRGQDPIDLGWQPIVGERVAFETLFTVMLPPYSGGVPDLAISFMREPFDTMVPKDKPIDEALGRALAAWARGSTAKAAPDEALILLAEIQATIGRAIPGRAAEDQRLKAELLATAFSARWPVIQKLPADRLRTGLATIRAELAKRGLVTDMGESEQAAFLEQFASDGPTGMPVPREVLGGWEESLLSAPDQRSLTDRWALLEANPTYHAAPVTIKTQLEQVRDARLAEITGDAASVKA